MLIQRGMKDREVTIVERKKTGARNRIKKRKEVKDCLKVLEDKTMIRAAQLV